MVIILYHQEKLLRMEFPDVQLIHRGTLGRSGLVDSLIDFTGLQNENFFLAEHLRVFSGVFKVADHEYDISFARLTLV